MPAVDLLFADGRGDSLADRSPVDGDGGLGSGYFGKVSTFTLNGAAVAVKELKTGSLDAASIGTRSVFRSKVLFFRVTWVFASGAVLVFVVAAC
jgi:hypothetical protein